MVFFEGRGHLALGQDGVFVLRLLEHFVNESRHLEVLLHPGAVRRLAVRRLNRVTSSVILFFDGHVAQLDHFNVVIEDLELLVVRLLRFVDTVVGQ